MRVTYGLYYMYQLTQQHHEVSFVRLLLLLTGFKYHLSTICDCVCWLVLNISAFLTSLLSGWGVLASGSMYIIECPLYCFQFVTVTLLQNKARVEKDKVQSLPTCEIISPLRFWACFFICKMPVTN